MRRCWRAVAVLALARADEVRFAAKVSSWWHSDVAPTFETLDAVAREHLRKKDYGAFQRATGTSVGELLAGLRSSDANATRDGATLPHEALPAVLPFLPAEALAVCSAVAKEWVAPDALWKDRVTREFGAVVAGGPWRRRYLDLRESQLLEEAGTYAGLC